MWKHVLITWIVSIALLLSPGILFAEEPPPADSLTPGTVEGTGTCFEITDSAYLNIQVSSQEEITALVESMPQTITMHIKAAIISTSTCITVNGLAPSTSYYIYTDNLRNLLPITTDSSGGLSFVQDLSTDHLIFIQPEKSTKFIRDDSTGGDCASIGSWDLSSKTCTLGMNLQESIEINGAGITLDGGDFSISGLGAGNGVYVTRGSHNVVITNLSINNFSSGAYVFMSDSIRISNSTFNNCWQGLYLYYSANSIIDNCKFLDNNYGLRAGYFNNGHVINNNFEANFAGVWSNTSTEKFNNYTGNTFSNNTHGIFYAGHSPGNIGMNYYANNVFLNNTSHGIKFQTNGGNIIEGNYVKGNYYGIFSQISNANIYFHNTFEANQTALTTSFADETIEVFQNNFLNNQGDVYCVFCADRQLGKELPEGGNYWSIYDTPEEGCFDQEADGFCDSPYYPGGFFDPHPWVKLNGWFGNNAPVLDPIGDRTGAEGQLLEFTVTATDPDGDNLIFAAANLPPGAAFDPATATFSWTPGFDQASVYPDVEFSVTDDGDPIEVDAELIAITVGNVNRPPVVDPVGSLSVEEFQSVTFTVTASDPDGDNFSIYAGLLPTGATFDEATGAFFWTPDATQVGNHTVPFYALDNGDPPLTGQTDVQIAVADVPPAEQGDNLIDNIIADELPTEVENAYLANLKKVSIFVEAGKITAAINQVEAFIQKTGQDLAQGLITQEQADYYIAVANEIINDLLGQ